MAKIMELYQMRQRVEEACRAFQSLDREVAKISLAPGDSAGLEAAIRQMEAAIDRKAAPFRGNTFVDPYIKPLKDQILRRDPRKGGGGQRQAVKRVARPLLRVSGEDGRRSRPDGVRKARARRRGTTTRFCNAPGATASAHTPSVTLRVTPSPAKPVKGHPRQEVIAQARLRCARPRSATRR